MDNDYDEDDCQGDGGEEHDGHESGGGNSGFREVEIREQDRFLPVANIARIMKKVLPNNAKIAKDAKEGIQECVSEFISFITSEASDKCQQEKRKTINGDDILWAMTTLGFDKYSEPLKIYLAKYRESVKGEKPEKKLTTTTQKKDNVFVPTITSSNKPALTTTSHLTQPRTIPHTHSLLNSSSSHGHGRGPTNMTGYSSISQPHPNNNLTNNLSALSTSSVGTMPKASPALPYTQSLTGRPLIRSSTTSIPSSMGVSGSIPPAYMSPSHTHATSAALASISAPTSLNHNPGIISAIATASIASSNVPSSAVNSSLSSSALASSHDPNKQGSTTSPNATTTTTSSSGGAVLPNIPAVGAITMTAAGTNALQSNQFIKQL